MSLNSSKYVTLFYSNYIYIECNNSNLITILDLIMNIINQYLEEEPELMQKRLIENKKLHEYKNEIMRELEIQRIIESDNLKSFQYAKLKRKYLKKKQKNKSYNE